MKRDDDQPNGQDNSPSNPQQKTDDQPASKRRLLGKLAVGGVAGFALPTQWTKPIVDTVVLPTHAQTSPTPEGSNRSVGGGGGGGGSGSVIPTPGSDLLDFFVSPAMANGVSDFCMEIEVFWIGNPNDAESIIGVGVTRVCYNSCKPDIFVEQFVGRVALSPSGNNWVGNVSGHQVIVSNIKANAASGERIANVQLGGVSGPAFRDQFCDCTCKT